MLFASATLPLVLVCMVLLQEIDPVKYSYMLIWFALSVSIVSGVVVIYVGLHFLFTKPLKLLNASLCQLNIDVPSSLRSHKQSSIVEIEELMVLLYSTMNALERHRADLQSAAFQQNMLMREVHHRVKNNFQVVASLISLQSSRIQQPDARAEFQSTYNRVCALATLHRHFYPEGELHTINMRNFLEELCGQLFQTAGEKIGDRISLEIDAPVLQISSDQAVPMSLIVTEAVSNAIKYAFPAGRRGLIGIHLTLEGSIAELSIVDDGVGMPPSRMDAGRGQRNGIGLTLIRGFARQLGATLTVEEGNGPRYFVRMELKSSTAKRFDSTEIFTSA